MNGIRVTLGRELRAYFLSPLAYIVAALLLVINGLTFGIILSFLNDPRAGIGAPLEYFFGETIFFWLVLLFITPVLTMHLISEERRSGTLEILMTAPITEAQVVLGKFLAALIFYVFLWLPTLSYAGIVAYYHKVDWGPVASGYLGILGIGALFLSIGVLASALTRSQLVAAILTFALLIPVFTFGLFETLTNSQGARTVFSYLNLWQHMGEFSKGIVDTRHLVYYASATAFFLFLATRALAVRKWR
ncbi:MAG: ABC transporter permease [Acidobacteria bacterium]|nr:ABC transporter permease [Acidobacteriota bacterium]MCZ6727515.1 ABC transporter permease [Acidobacteriota bacterium]